MRKSSGATAIFMTSKFRFQLGFSRIIFLILYQFMTFFSKFLIFLTSIFLSKIVLRVIYFHRYSKKFFRKNSSIFFESRVSGKFPWQVRISGQFWKKCPTGYRACYFSTKYLNAILFLKSYIPKNRNIFSSVQYAERNLKIRSEFRRYYGWTFSFQCAIIDL